ncbi:MAG TPA: hypothetical protein VHD83_20505 [Puia sp.]|nr:hypothetical protein [Puia sp.]
MKPPLLSQRLSRLRRMFWLFFLLTIGYMIWVRNYLSPLRSGEIVQLEIAKTVSKAQFIIQDWKANGKYEQGMKSTSIAYLFMALYTVAIVLGCRFVSVCTGNEILIKGGRLFAWMILLATVCDVVENIVLSRTLSGDISQGNVLIAYNLARIKFSIVIVCVLFMVACALYWIMAQFSKEKK